MKSGQMWLSALMQAGIAYAAAAVILCCLYAATFQKLNPEFEPFMNHTRPPIEASGATLIPISVGSYLQQGEAVVIEAFNEDEAIFTLARSFSAEDYPFVKVNISGLTRYMKAKILWRKANDPSRIHALELNLSKGRANQVAMVHGEDAYRGNILDLALLLYEAPSIEIDSNSNFGITVESIELRPFSTRYVIEQIFTDLLSPPLWQARSNNIVVGVHNNSLVLPNLATHLLMLVGSVLISVFVVARRVLFGVTGGPQLWSVYFCLCVCGHLNNEAYRWDWRVQQGRDVAARYTTSVSDAIKRSEIRCARRPLCGAETLPHY